MRNFYKVLCALAFFAGTQVHAQYALVVEEYSTGVVDDQSTYRLYIQMENSDDFLSSVYGNELFPLAVQSSDGFYNDAFGSTVASGINPLIFGVFPSAMVDSWVTIGIDS